MESAEEGERSGRVPQPLQIDPKWYVRHTTSLALLTAQRMQLSRCSQDFLPTHQDRRPPPRLLHDVQEGGNRVRYRLRQEV